MPNDDERQREMSPDNAATEPEEAEWELRLYVAGQTTKSITALANLKKFAEEHLHGKYHIEVIDLDARAATRTVR